MSELQDSTRRDMRRLLKTFGVSADEALTTYLREHPEVAHLHVRITLQGTASSEGAAAEPLQLEIEDTITQ
jgi:hypothetical protein